MNAKILLCVSVASAFFGGSVLAHTPALETLSTARVTKVSKIPALDTAPVPVKKVCPTYPYEMRRDGIEGIVIVDMLVDSTGRVVAAELVSTTAAPELNTVVLAAAKEWIFVPATAQGKTITTRVRVPFEFTMPQLLALASR